MARACERPKGANSAARGTRRATWATGGSPERAARLGRREVLCGAVGRDSKGQPARTKHGDASTAGSEQRERPKRAASRASPASGASGTTNVAARAAKRAGTTFGGPHAWGFAGLHLEIDRK